MDSNNQQPKDDTSKNKKLEENKIKDELPLIEKSD